ncbi:MAG TPA: hypothetical protein VIE69_06965 [Methylophilaceae bacterium]
MLVNNWWDNTQVQARATSLKSAGDAYLTNLNKAAAGDTAAAHSIVTAVNAVTDVNDSFWNSSGLTGLDLVNAKNDVLTGSIPNGTVNPPADQGRGFASGIFNGETDDQAVATAQKEVKRQAMNKGFAGYFSGLAFLAGVTGAGIGLNSLLAGAAEGSAASFTNGIVLSDASAADSLAIAPTAGVGTGLGVDLSVPALAPGVVVSDASFTSALAAATGSPLTSFTDALHSGYQTASAGAKAVQLVDGITGQTKPLTQGQSVPAGWYVQSTPGVTPPILTSATTPGAVAPQSFTSQATPTTASSSALVPVLVSAVILAGLYYWKTHS